MFLSFCLLCFATSRSEQEPKTAESSNAAAQQIAPVKSQPKGLNIGYKSASACSLTEAQQRNDDVLACLFDQHLLLAR